MQVADVVLLPLGEGAALRDFHERVAHRVGVGECELLHAALDVEDAVVDGRLQADGVEQGALGDASAGELTRRAVRILIQDVGLGLGQLAHLEGEVANLGRYTADLGRYGDHGLASAHVRHSVALTVFGADLAVGHRGRHVATGHARHSDLDLVLSHAAGVKDTHQGRCHGGRLGRYGVFAAEVIRILAGHLEVALDGERAGGSGADGVRAVVADHLALAAARTDEELRALRGVDGREHDSRFVGRAAHDNLTLGHHLRHDLIHAIVAYIHAASDGREGLSLDVADVVLILRQYGDSRRHGHVLKERRLPRA